MDNYTQVHYTFPHGQQENLKQSSKFFSKFDSKAPGWTISPHPKHFSYNVMMAKVTNMDNWAAES